MTIEKREKKTGKLHPSRGGEPELDPKYHWLREAFFWLSMRRPVSFGGPLMIPYSEMLVYAKYKLQLDKPEIADFIEVMEQLDAVWSDHLQSKGQRGHKVESDKPIGTK